MPHDSARYRVSNHDGDGVALLILLLTAAATLLTLTLRNTEFALAAAATLLTLIWAIIAVVRHVIQVVKDVLYI